MFGRSKAPVNTVEDTDTGQFLYPNFSTSLHTAPTRMRSYNGSLVRNANRQAPSSDMDVLPHQLRSYVNASGVQDVQILNGLAYKRLTGKITGYVGEGYLYAAAPIIPGQQRGDAAGFRKKGPSPLNVQAIWEAGPGSQPDNPGGPGQVIGTRIINPMSG